MTLPTSSIGCPMDAMLKLLMGQWTSYIIWTLQNNGPLRFGELKRQISGVSSKVLTERLRMLETHRIVFREVKPTSPPEVTYGLTERGNELVVIMKPLYEMACRWMKEDHPEEYAARQKEKEAAGTKTLSVCGK